MKPEDVATVISRLDGNNIPFESGPPCPPADLIGLEQLAGKSLPDQIPLVLSVFNGLKIHTRKLEIMPAREWQLRPNEALRFALIAERHELVFDTRQRNQADQWTILNAHTGYVVTVTLASFIANKMWDWVEKGRPIWEKAGSPNA